MSRNALPSPGRIVLAAIVVVSTVWAGLLFARSTGRFGEALTADGCECHSTTPNANGDVTVSIVGPQAVEQGSTNDYTIFASGGPSGGLGGFNLKAQDGTLIAGDNVQVGGTPAGTEITHTNSSTRVWHFSWIAPATSGPVEFYAIAQCVNGNGNINGDSWNFYGGSVGAPFTIDVSPLLAAGNPGAPLLSLLPAAPNPFISSAQIRFTLAKAGPANVAVFDLSGRRIATLASGELAAGTHEVVWNGRTDRGQAVNAGVYLVRLSSDGRVLSTRVVRASR